MPLDISNFSKPQEDPSELPASVVTDSSGDVRAPVATGTAATDTANLAAAITATPVGGTLWLDGHYKINAALTFPGSIAVKGREKVTYTGLSALPSGPNALSQINGTIIEQTVAATDALDVTIAGGTFHMDDIIVGFTSGLASTGHGINIAPTSNVVGVYGGALNDVMVFGHDGNHYALVLNNELEVTTRDFRWSGGGGILTICQAGLGYNTGNNGHIHPYGVLSASGTAHGYAHSSAVSSGGSGLLNLLTYIRPQVNITGAAGTAGTQKLWTDSVGAGLPQYITVISADLEASGYANTLDYGPTTKFLGDTYVASTATINLINALNVAVGTQALAKAGQNAGTQQKSVAVGQNALAALTTAQSNTAVGYNTLPLLATGSGRATAVGYGTLTALTTGYGNTAIGANAGASNPVTQNQCTFVGDSSGTNGDNFAATAIGASAKGNASRSTALGTGAVAGASGVVAIGVDHVGTSATSSTQDVIALGTALHQVQLANNTTGAGSAALGANSPAVTNAAPYTWFKMMSSDGSTVYVPAWK